jgi:hypothetical protein
MSVKDEEKDPDAPKREGPKIPVYPVVFGAERSPPDVAVVALAAPPTVFKDIDAPVKVRFRATGLKPQDLLLTLSRPGEEDKPLDQKVIKHDGTDQDYETSLQARMETEGRQSVVVSVTPRGENVKETSLANNKQSLIINVADDTSRVLLVDGEARWEFHYLWNALLRDRTMKVQSVVFVQPRLGALSEEELKKARNPALTLPTIAEDGHDPLNDFDCIILGDVLPEHLPPPDRVRLEKYVADRGGTLVILAGKRGMPLAFLPERGPDEPGKPEGAGKDDQDPLVKLLPIENPHVVAPEEGFHVTLTGEGKQADFLRLEATGSTADQLRRWAEMPPHYWGVVGTAKPGATTLAYVGADEENLKPEEKVKKERENSLFVRHNYGFGRVFFVGVDSTWRYRYRVGDLYHHRFWSQTIRWAATDKPLVTGNKYVRFGTPQAVFRDDEAVNLTVRFNDEAGKLPAELTAQARVLRKDDKAETSVAVVTLKRRAMQPRVFDAQVRDLPAGKYEIELAIPDLADKLQDQPGPDGKTSPLRAPFTVSPGEHGEMVQLAANFSLMEQIAKANGTNKVYTPETAGEVIDLLTAKEIKKKDRIDAPLWRWWVVLVAVLSLLTIEWVVRKWAGLP